MGKMEPAKAAKADSGDAEEDPEDPLDSAAPEDSDTAEDAAGEDPDAEDVDEGDDEDEDPDAPEDDDEDEKEEADPKAPAVSDDQEIEVTVNGETQKVTIGSLKRLAGQEAQLTRVSQEAHNVGRRATAALQAAIETVGEDLKPYEDVDWLVLQGELSPEEFAWHRENAGKAKRRYDALLGQARQAGEALEASQSADRDRQAQAASAELQRDVPDWSPALYQEIMRFGVSAGLDENDVSQITSAPVIKLLRKAMLYDKGAKATADKVRSAPTRRVRSGKGDLGASAPGQSAAKAANSMKRLKSGAGSNEDAMAVLMSRWG